MCRGAQRVGIVCALLLSGQVALGQGGPADEIRQTQEKMAKLYEAKDAMQKALAIWQGLLKKHPKDRAYMNNVCRIASNLGKHAIALPIAKRLLDLEPSNSTYRRRLAEALLAAKRPKEALPHLAWLLKKNPDDAPLREDVAGIYEMMKKPRLALTQYDWLLKRKPAPSKDKLMRYRIARMHLYGDLKLESKRLAELKALQRDYPKNLEVRRELATSYIDSEKYDEARAELKAILALKKNDPQSLAQLAKLEQTRRDAKRRAALERAQEERYRDWLLDLQQRAEDF